MNEGTSSEAGDHSGKGNHGKLVNFPANPVSPSGWGQGRLGKALSFDGTNDYVAMGNIAGGQIQTISFWIKADNLSKKILDLNGTATVEVISGTITANSFTSPTIYRDGIVSSIIDTNWHHVAITTGTAITASAMDIGRINPNYFLGTLDEVRVYNRALSSDEVKTIYRSGRTLVNASQTDLLKNGLVGMWSFDGKFLLRGKALDTSGLNNDGILTNGPAPAAGKGGQALNFDGGDDQGNVGSCLNF